MRWRFSALFCARAARTRLLAYSSTSVYDDVTAPRFARFIFDADQRETLEDLFVLLRSSLLAVVFFCFFFFEGEEEGNLCLVMRKLLLALYRNRKCFARFANFQDSQVYKFSSF